MNGIGAQNTPTQESSWFRERWYGRALFFLGGHIKTGNWITGFFEWFFSQVSRISGPGMTIAVGYLIIYAMEMHRSTAITYPKPDQWDALAHFADGFVNVAPEIVFPGVAVLGIISAFRREKLNAWLYCSMATVFFILTMVVLHANSDGAITNDFVQQMLLWRAFAAIVYTVVVEICHQNKGLDYPEIQALVQSLRDQMKGLSQERDRLQETLQSEQKSLRSIIDGLRDEQQSLRSTIDQQKSIIDRQKSTVIDLQKSTIDQENLSFTIDRQQATIDQQVSEIESLRALIDQRNQGQSSLYGEIDRLNATIHDLQIQIKKSTEKSIPESTEKSTDRPEKSDRSENRPSEKSTIDLKKSTSKSMRDEKESLSKQPIDFQKSIEGLSKKSTDTREIIKKFIEDATNENRPFTYDDICESTGFSIQTVKKYGPNIKKELGLTGNTDEMKAINE
jgi:hemerythrin-like domain-containing protein